MDTDKEKYKSRHTKSKIRFRLTIIKKTVFFLSAILITKNSITSHQVPNSVLKH